MRSVLAAVLVLFSLLSGCEIAGTETVALTRAAVRKNWPPQVNQPFPDLELIDQTGKLFRMSTLKGKVVLVEFVGMSCPACQAFSGAHRVGSYGSTKPQRNVESTSELLQKWAGGVSFDDERFAFVQILLYDSNMRAPTARDARAWAEHFGLKRERNRIVLAGTDALVNQASYDRIPGFQLVDRDFVLRVDATGNRPPSNLRSELMPTFGRMVRAKR